MLQVRKEHRDREAGAEISSLLSIRSESSLFESELLSDQVAKALLDFCVPGYRCFLTVLGIHVNVVLFTMATQIAASIS
jgi:hypothetical protein